MLTVPYTINMQANTHVCAYIPLHYAEIIKPTVTKSIKVTLEVYQGPSVNVLFYEIIVQNWAESSSSNILIKPFI